MHRVAEYARWVVTMMRCRYAFVCSSCGGETRISVTCDTDDCCYIRGIKFPTGNLSSIYEISGREDEGVAVRTIMMIAAGNECSTSSISSRLLC